VPRMSPKPIDTWNYCLLIYSLLTPSEREVLTDGCGAKDIFVKEEGPFYVRWTLKTIEAVGSFLTFPNRYCQKFDHNCRVHDIGFIVGGTPAHFNALNRSFHQYNLDIVRNDYVGKFWSWLGYHAIQKVGKDYYDFLPQPRTIEEVKVIARGRIEELRGYNET
jgi:hypothetical protein